MTVHDRIETNPKIMLGKLVIRGTRITPELIVRKIAEGAEEKAVLEAYPRLTRADIRAALNYAADTVAHEEIVLSPALARACFSSPTRAVSFQSSSVREPLATTLPRSPRR